MTYKLIDSGDQKRLEQFGDFTLIRPAGAALWKPVLKKEWNKADATFSREPENHWKIDNSLPKSWQITLNELQFKIQPTDFGHLGIFPEHASLWEWLCSHIRPSAKVLNLFAYSGGATLALAKEGAEVCHVDASKGMVDWARKNAQLNKLEKKPIRWIVDDAIKFMKREVRRKSFYDGIILDPPSFGRGKKGEVFKLEEHLIPLLQLCAELLSENPLFVLLSSHTPGVTPTILHHLLSQILPKGKVEQGEMLLHSDQSFSLPLGAYARWYR